MGIIGSYVMWTLPPSPATINRTLGRIAPCAKSGWEAESQHDSFDFQAGATRTRARGKNPSIIVWRVVLKKESTRSSMFKAAEPSGK